MKLFTFYQSGSSYRVRILLNLKGIDYEPVFVIGGRGSADLAKPEYLALNPHGVIPTLIDGDTTIIQTLAIAEYLEETHPDPALLPTDATSRARVRALAQSVVSDIHPLSTARVNGYLGEDLELAPDAIKAWQRHWNRRGFAAIETLLADAPQTGAFCHGERPTIADACLVSQVYAAGKFGIGIGDYPTIGGIYETCMKIDAFQRAAPENQPDAPATKP